MKILKPSSEIDQEGIFLPQEIILNILSRAPIQTALACKCVCKPWLNLIKTPEFAQRHLSNSVPGWLVFGNEGAGVNVFRTFDFEESPEVDHHLLRYKPVLELRTKKFFAFASAPTIEGSANGLLCFRNWSRNREDYCILNPIAREFLRFSLPEWIEKYDGDEGDVAYGFGVSRLSNQYKVVRILHESTLSDYGDTLSVSDHVCHVYTLQTRSWRSIVTPREVLLDYRWSNVGTFLDGNLYWLTKDLNGTPWIVSIDLETEVFTKFSTPTGVGEDFRVYLASIGVARDRLCFCDNSSDTEIFIYLMMNDCGDDEITWGKEYVVSKLPEYSGDVYEPAFVVKASGDGDLLLLRWQDEFFFRYCNRTKTLDELKFGGGYGYQPQIISFTPSLISLRSLEAGNAKQL